MKTINQEAKEYVHNEIYSREEKSLGASESEINQDLDELDVDIDESREEIISEMKREGKTKEEILSYLDEVAENY